MDRNNQATGAVILLVEDEPLIRMNTADMCEDAGYSVVEAPNADTALALLVGRSDVQLIMTDIDMPGSMDGLALAHLVRESRPDMALLLASGKAFPPQRDLPSGARFFSKPFQERDILEAMADLLASSPAQ